MQSMENLLPFYSFILKIFNAFSVVALAISSIGNPFSFAISSATSVTYTGSLRFPRYGCGVKYGASVSINNLSNGISVATSFGVFAFLNVTGPPSEIIKFICNAFFCCFNTSTKTMHNAARRFRLFFFQNTNNICCRISVMNNNWQINFFSKLNLFSKYFLLNIFRRFIPMIIKSCFSDADNFRMRCKRFNPLQVFFCTIDCINRMPTDNSVYERITSLLAPSLY